MNSKLLVIFLVRCLLLDFATVKTLSLPRKTDKTLREEALLRYKRALSVIGGKDVERGAWPWQAFFWPPGCGGVLVDYNYVLTAKHCTNGRGSIVVTLGEHDRRRNERTDQRRRVKSIYRHPKTDAALLYLDQPASPSRYVKPLKLISGAYPVTGTMATVTGWGYTKSGVSVPADILQELELPIVAWDICARQVDPMFRRVRARPLQTHEVCAGRTSGPYANSCHGDSGGPLVQKQGANWELIGIVSRSAPDCPEDFDYSVYLSISGIRGWIENELRKERGPHLMGVIHWSQKVIQFPFKFSDFWNIYG